jgi:hypothetical protein
MTIPVVGALWASSIAKRGVWATWRCAFAWLLGAALFVVVCYGVLSGRYWKWQAERSKERALAAAAEAVIEADRRRQAESSFGIAANARTGMDQVQFTVNLPAEESAQRIEAQANADPDPAAGHPDPDIVRVLEEAEGRVSTAAGRLQRADSR